MPTPSPLRPRPRARSRLGALVVLASLVAGILPILPARAAAESPQLRLRVGSDLVTARRVKHQPLYFDPGVWVTAAEAPFEIWLRRPDYALPLQVEQVLHDASGTEELRSLPVETLDQWLGFKDFFRIDVYRDSELVRSKTMAFCPNSYDRQRVSDAGPDRPSFPDGCYGNPFTKGLVWGIDEGWAVNPSSSFTTSLRLKDGLYDVSFSIEPSYVDILELDPATTTAALQLKVKTVRGFTDCPDCPPHPSHYAPGTAWSSAPVPDMTDPDPALLPDLLALPSWGISVRQGREHTRLSFGATVWTAGAASLVVEGFRREDEDVMDAFQYFYSGDEVVGRAAVGSLEFDEKRGHRHWHFLQFARYSLLDETMTEVIFSRKEAFCLAPTDAIDLTLPNADWAPGQTGLNTACGGPQALWVREVLPLGWGDTYFQGVAGQSFDITDLPNGTYYIKVEANPLGLLHEQDTTNNSELREIIIRGRDGARRVEVPPWNGIDTEGIFNGGCC